MINYHSMVIKMKKYQVLTKGFEMKDWENVLEDLTTCKWGDGNDEEYLFNSLYEALLIKNRYIVQEEEKGLLEDIHFSVSVDYFEEE